MYLEAKCLELSLHSLSPALHTNTHSLLANFRFEDRVYSEISLVPVPLIYRLLSNYEGFIISKEYTNSLKCGGIY